MIRPPALFFLCLLCATLPHCAAAASFASPAEHFAHQAWTTENGLPQNSVHQVLQTRDGYIWVATEGGVARFDGAQFTIFNAENQPAFTSNDICCLAEDATGALWIGTADGLLRFAQGTFRRYALPDGLPSPAILAIAASAGSTLFVLTTSGLAQFQADRFTPLTLPASALASAPDGSTWLATPQGALRYRAGAFQPVPLAGYPTDPVEAIGTLPDGSPWVSTRTALLLWRSGKLETWPFTAARLQSLTTSASGSLWAGTSKGLLRLPRDGSPEPSLGEESILSLFADREGSLWAGTDTAGLHILRQQRFRTLPPTTGLAITAITQDTAGTMWSGSAGEGLFGFTKAGETKHLTTSGGLVSNVILTLAAAPDGTLWIGTPDGLNHLRRDGTVDAITSADGLPDDLVRSLFADRDGTLWVGTRRGLAHLDGTHITVLSGKPGLGSDLIGAMLRTSTGDLWIGTLAGLTRLRDGRLTSFTRAQGLSGDVITALLEARDGTLWVGTRDGGLSVSNPSGNFTAVSATNLPTSIDAIVEDAQGFLWLSSNRGTARVSANELKSCIATCTPQVTRFGTSDGMPSEEASSGGHPGAFAAATGELWFATRKGVAILNPATLNTHPPAIPVVIEHMRLDDAEWPIGASAAIPPGHTRYAFEFAALSFAAPSKIRYRYMLEGFESRWTDAASRRTAFYTNLPPRHYRFRVQASGEDGLWTAPGASFSFAVQPPFYRTSWFLALAALLLAALVFAGYRTRVSVLQSQLQSRFDAILAERNRIAREIHDTLAQGFAGVSVQLELTAHLLAQSHLAAATEQVDRTRALVREGLADARRSIWELRASTTAAALPMRLTHLAERAATPHLDVKINIGGTYRPLPPDFEQEILRIAQEALANVTRHSGATQVQVHLRYHPTGLTLSVADNGRGFSAHDSTLVEKGHFGLQGMHERAAQIGATLTVESSPEHGTTVQLEAPLAPGKLAGKAQSNS